MIDPDTYIYYNASTQRNNEPPKWNPGVYSTDLVGSDALAYLDEASESDRPFFVGVAPIGPHGEVYRITTEDGETKNGFFPPVPADRHKHLFPGLKVPRTPNFNPEEVSQSYPRVTFGND